MGESEKRELAGRVVAMNLDFDSAFTERTPRIVNAAKPVSYTHL